jgi:glycosyltransferase involved in cell wall biosynthesis
MRELAIVMPVYNEEECILDVVNSWLDEIKRLKIDAEIIVLNDGSKDGTKDKLAALDNNEMVTVINKDNSGHGPTILQGYRLAVNRAEYVFQTDSDDEMKPDRFNLLWKERGNYDAVFGIRDSREQNLARKIISKVSRMTVKMCFGSGVSDVNVPYRLIKSSLLKSIVEKIPDDTFAPNIVISGALCTRKIPVLNIPIPHENRKTGSVSIMKWKLWKSAYKAFRQTIRISQSLR